MIFVQSDIFCHNISLNSGECSINQYSIGVCTIPKVSFHFVLFYSLIFTSGFFRKHSFTPYLEQPKRI